MAVPPFEPSAASSITVVVRVRPFTPKETAQLSKTDDSHFILGDGSLAQASVPRLTQRGLRSVIKVVDDRCLVFDPPESSPIQKFSRSVVPQGKRVKDQTFAFDQVFDAGTTQQDVYEASTKSLLDSVLNGYNSTVFAYGATGCGKTHTITGTAEQPGIIFMAMQELFERIQDLQDEKVTEISLSYLEIYNETIRDLLVPGGSKQSLNLREDANQSVSVVGLTNHRPHNVQEVMDLIVRGNEYRTMSPTEANATSSRSHAVLQINVSQKDRNADINEPHTVATLSIIDLAGSERASATKNRGDRLLEGANINKSLLALGSCINALCDMRRKQHVPYRNSKLTRLLKFSLGGNCRTVMIVCVSPSSAHFDETQNTLRYANRAKNIQTKVHRNVFNVDRHVKDFLKKINEQMAMIEELKGQLRNHEEFAFAKFQKLASKRESLLQEGLSRLRSVCDSRRAERKAMLDSLQDIRHRIQVGIAWVAAVDKLELMDELDVSPKRRLVADMLSKLDDDRSKLEHRISELNSDWHRALDSALSTGERQLRELDPLCSMEIQVLHDEAKLLHLESTDVTGSLPLGAKTELRVDTCFIEELIYNLFEAASTLSSVAASSSTGHGSIGNSKSTLENVMKKCACTTDVVLGIVSKKAHGASSSVKYGSGRPGPLELDESNFLDLSLQNTPARSQRMNHLSSPRLARSPGKWRTLKSPAKAVGPMTPKRKAKGRSVRWRDAEEGQLADFNSPCKIVESPEVESLEGSDREDVITHGDAGSTPTAPRISILPLDDERSEIGGIPFDHTGGDKTDTSENVTAPATSEPKARMARFQSGFLSKRLETTPPGNRPLPHSHSAHSPVRSILRSSLGVVGAAPNTSPSSIPVHVRSVHRVVSSELRRDSSSGSKTSGRNVSMELRDVPRSRESTLDSELAPEKQITSAPVAATSGPDPMKELEKVLRRTSIHGGMRARKSQRRRSSGLPASLNPDPGATSNSAQTLNTNLTGGPGGPFSIHNLRRGSRAADTEWKTASVLSPRPGIVKQGGRRTTIGGNRFGVASSPRSSSGSAFSEQRRPRHSMVPVTMSSTKQNGSVSDNSHLLLPRDHRPMGRVVSGRREKPLVGEPARAIW